MRKGSALRYPLSLFPSFAEKRRGGRKPEIGSKKKRKRVYFFVLLAETEKSDTP